MRKFLKILFIILFLSFIVFPLFPTITKAQVEYPIPPIIFRVGTSALPGDWDPAITDGYNVIYKTYFPSCAEYPCAGNAGFWGGTKEKILPEEWKPILCTDWEVEYWPSEENSLGWNNTGGIKSTLFTLREGVKFHDGSDWNATVMKWNIDRLYIISGNLTGNGDMRRRDLYWLDVEDDKPYFTSGWDLTEYDAPNIGDTPPVIPPGPNDYSYYYLDEFTTIYNPNPYGGWDYIAEFPIHYSPYDKYPIVRRVDIVEAKQSGGQVKVWWNSWNSNGMDGGVYSHMISYHTYHKHYSDRGIYGYDNDVQDSKNPTQVNHLIGTGPYKFSVHDETASPSGGYMEKFEDYWNKTALEAEGLFDVERVEIINFPGGRLGTDAKNTALLTHAIDACVDSASMPIDYDAIMANPDIDYIEGYSSTYKTQITLNCINETFWAWPSVEGTRKIKYSDQETSAGIPRALREAMTYAFDYDNMIDTVLDGHAIRGGGVIGIENIYYNASVPLPGYDLEKAREILLTTKVDPILTDPIHAANSYFPNPDLYNFSKLCADRGLSSSSTDLDWQNVANIEPIFVLNFYWDDTHEDLKNFLQSSLENIGMALKDKTGATNKVPTIIWDTVRTYWLSTFDGLHSIWSSHAWVMDFYMPSNIPEDRIAASYYDPENGLWRTLGMGGITEMFPWWNYGFCYDDEINSWIDRMHFSDPKNKSKWISKIAYKEQNELFPMLYCYQAKTGICLWRDWETFWVKNRVGKRSFYWEDISFHFLKYALRPGDFTLSTNAGTPDKDGKFNLTWTAADKALNYSVYEYSSYITIINSSLTSLVNGTINLSLLLSGYSDGTYYFITMAHNARGNTLSNCIKVIVKTKMIQGYNSYILLILFTIVTIFIIRKKIIRKKRKKLYH